MVTPMSTTTASRPRRGTDALATHLLDHGHDGIVVNGTTGESRHHLRRREAPSWCGPSSRPSAAAPRSSPASAPTTPRTPSHLASRPRQAGAHGLLVVTPYYNKPTAGRACVAHFSAVADATDLPVMLYDIPGRTGIADRTPRPCCALAEHPHIVAVKDAKGDLFAATPGDGQTDLPCYSGDDAPTSPTSRTAPSASSASWPRRRPAVRRDGRRRRRAATSPRAIAVHRQLIPVVDAVMTHTQGAIMAKAALKVLGVTRARRAVRLPLVEATADQVALLRDGLATAHGPAREPSPPRADRPAAAARTAPCASSPLGGLGEIGRNMTVFEYGGQLLIVDCGVLFPEDHQPGVDLILPDFEHIADRLDDVVAIVLTHGHEDHIGAVPYLLRLKADIPLVGSQLTLALVEAKLKEHRIKPYTLTVTRGAARAARAFDLEFVAVNHSIPDALAVAIRTPAGTLLHTGDFKMDQLPLDGRLTDLRAFARLGEEGVDLFLTDSTNAEVPGFTTPERDIAPAIDRVFRRPSGGSSSPASPRTCTACSRCSTPPPKHGRKVALVGRSMVRNMGIAARARLPARAGRRARRRQEARRPAGRPGRADVHRFPGRADGGAVPDGQPRPPDRGRRGRHRAAGLARSSPATRTRSTASSTG